MALLNLNYKRLLLSMLTIALVSCSNPWEDRENNGDVNLSVTLNEAITNTAEVSQFGKLLVQTGYDKILAASKTYTVFVPTNEAMGQVDNAILNNPEALKKFVANHIALTAYSSIRTKAQEKIKMLGDKYLLFKGSTLIDDATIIDADHYANNGVYHIINKALTPKLNIWQYINAQSSSSAMSAYLLSLKDFSIYNDDIAAKAGSAPGYLADSLSNSYLRNVYNLNNEKNSYTLFLMQDDGYNAEVNKMKPYLIKTSNNVNIDSTAIYSKYFTLRDMAFPKKYELNDLPATLTSRFGIEVPVDKTQIVGEPIHLSNGIVYIMKKVDVALTKRLLTTKIEGEKNTSYLGARFRILYRDRKDPFGTLYNDVAVLSTGTGLFTLNYNAKDLYSTTYKVYWRAVNEQSNVFQQRLVVGTYIKDNVYDHTKALMAFPYMDLPIKLYSEVYLGDFTLTKSGNIDLISLISLNSTTASLSLDYFKFVPVLK
ncbi:MAG: hypothetical protein RLZZ540_1652 [Bacteroidota bacterium]|jgi:uncharacterized surface protein with fasciclin (FAS1) repeats